MKALLIALTIASSIFSLSAAADAHSTYKQCVEEAGRVYANNIAAGMPTSVADDVLEADLATCANTYSH